MLNFFSCFFRRCAPPEEKSVDLYLCGVSCISGFDRCEGIMAPAPPHIKATRADVLESQRRGKSITPTPEQAKLIEGAIRYEGI